MKALFWIGLVVLILGIASLVVPIPRSEREGFRAGGVSVGVETRQDQVLSPFVSVVMILGGARHVGRRKGEKLVAASKESSYEEPIAEQARARRGESDRSPVPSPDCPGGLRRGSRLQPARQDPTRNLSESRWTLPWWCCTLR